MELRLRLSPLARRAAMTAALGVFLVPAAASPAPADAAKRAKKRYPVVTSVRPMNVAIGETLEVRGKNFRRGKSKNTVVFKRDGARAVFAKVPVGTTKLLRLTVPDKLAEFFAIQAGSPVSTRFRIRVLSKRFGKRFTRNGLSPTIGPARPPATIVPAVAPPNGDCDGDGQLNGVDGDDDNDLLDDETERSLGLDSCKPDTDGDGVADRFEFDCDRDGVLNRDESDDDNDLLDDALETSIGTDPCSSDSDGDGVPDGYEYQSARDLNDDEYQDPNSYLPYPGKSPYPNALFSDANVDHDGDSLTLVDEFRLWKGFGNTGTLDALVYSAGEAYSMSARDGTGRRRPTLLAAGYSKHADFLNWAGGLGQYAGMRQYNPVILAQAEPWHDPSNQGAFDIRDTNRSGGVPEGNRVGYLTSESLYYDLDADGYLSDDERDEDADGLTNYDESHGRMLSAYWAGCYSGEKAYGVVYAGTDLADGDSDGDGTRDGADDQDHDDIPNLMEISRNAASGHADWDQFKGFCVLDEDLLNADGNDSDTNPDAPKTLHPADFGRVNPFNPCLPYTWSRTCERHPSLNGGAAPFDGSTNWASLQ